MNKIVCKSVKNKHNFSGIMLNQDFNNIDELELPNKKVYCHTGQDVTFALRGGGYNNIKEYLVLFNLGFNQYKIDNRYKFFTFHVATNSIFYKKITIRAPMNKGKYEIWCLMAKNPSNFYLNRDDLRHCLDYSHRITLIVE